MSPRFRVRKLKNHSYHDWSLEDALCVGSPHNFKRWTWPQECTGKCGTFLFHETAIKEASA